jgi:hypothetical protein
VGTHQHVAFAVENITQVQSQTNLRQKYTSKGGYALAAAADTNLHTRPQSFSQTVGTLGTEPTWDNIIRCFQYLDDANCDEDGRFIIVRPATYYAMLKLEEVKNSLYGGNQGAAVRKGAVNQIMGATVYKTTLVRAPAGGQAENWVCHREGVYYCSQQLKTNNQFSIHMDSDVVSMTHIYGYAEALQPPITAGGGAATDVFNTVLYGTS